MTNAPSRIAMVVHSLNHNNIGRVYPFLAAFIGQPDISIKLIGWDSGGELFPLLKDLPWPIVRMQGPQRGAWAEQQLSQAVRECSLIHCFKAQDHLHSVAAVAQQHSMPVVLDVDDWELGLYLEGITAWPAWRKWLWGGPMTKRIAAGLELEHLARTAPTATIANSTALQAHFGGQILYTAADAEAFAPDREAGQRFRAAHGIAAQAPVIGFLGTPHAHKGIDDLLEAFARIRADKPQAVLVFVGVPSHNRYAKQLAQTEGVIVTGYIAAGDYPAAYAACDVIAIPQRPVTEGIMQTPAKLILGLAAGRAIVATSVGDMPAIIGDAGVIVAPEQPEALAQAIGDLLRDPMRRARLGMAARERFLERFTLEQMRTELWAIYQAAVRAAHRR